MKTSDIIIKQLGNKALMMLGANTLLSFENGLSFKIKGSKLFKYIKIELNSLDLYDITFVNYRGMNITNSKTVNNVYVDTMHKLIESETKLYTSL